MCLRRAAGRYESDRGGTRRLVQAALGLLQVAADVRHHRGAQDGHGQGAEVQDPADDAGTDLLSMGRLVRRFRSPHHYCRKFVMRASEPKPH